nr:hypothetical protein [Tanacetum cinerariifolium]
LQQTSTQIPTPSITTVAPAATTVPDPLPAIAHRDEDNLVRVVPNLRKRDREEDEDHPVGSNQGKRKRSLGKESKPSKTSLASKETSKCDTSPILNLNDWFKQPPSPPTPDLKWNKCQVVDDQPEQPCFNNMLFDAKDLLTFNELMATPIDFSKFIKNRLKLYKITKAYLVGLVYNLLKGTCQSSIELKYNIDE